MHERSNNEVSSGEPRPLIYAHRGSTLLAPENTREAFDLALSFQADILETDVRLSADGQVIVTHDETLERTTNGSGTVASHTLEQLKQLDAGFHFIDLEGCDYRGKNIVLLSLSELFQLYPKQRINIDIKDNNDQAAVAVVNAIEESQRQETVTVGSFHRQVLLKVRKLAPGIRTAALREEVIQLYFRQLMGRKPPLPRDYQVLQIPCSYFGIPLATPSFINHIKSLQLEISFWTVNDTAMMRKLSDLGADGLVTDRPDLAADVLLSGN